MATENHGNSQNSHQFLETSETQRSVSLLPTLEKSAGFFEDQFSSGGVLVVDDEPDVRSVVRMTLEKAGFHVIEAENGEQAIDTINVGENPLVLDVIITDIRMPIKNGVEAMAYFQREYPNVPLIVLTGFPNIDMVTAFLKKGIVDYLVKPVEKDKLLAAVTRAMNKRHVRRV